MSFKMAGSLAFKDGMSRARPTLLEPIMDVEVYAPSDFAGDLMGDLNSRRGRIGGMDTRGASTIIRAKVPMSEMLTYEQHLTSATGGRGSYHMEFSHYEEVPPHLHGKIIAAAKAERGAGGGRRGLSECRVPNAEVQMPNVDAERIGRFWIGICSLSASASAFSNSRLRPPAFRGGRRLGALAARVGTAALLALRRGPAWPSSCRVFLAPSSRLGLLAAQALGRGAQAAADALRLRLFGRLGGLLGLGVRVVLAADQLDLRDLGAVAAAVAEPQDARVAARPRLEARRDRVEQLADDVAILDVAQHQPARVQRPCRCRRRRRRRAWRW